MECCNVLQEYLDEVPSDVRAGVAAVVVGFGAHYFLLGPNKSDAMMRSDIDGMFSTVERFCAGAGCLGAVRDYSAQHFLTEAGDYTSEAAKAMAEQANPCQCSIAAADEAGGWRSRSWGSQGNDLGVATRFAAIVHETGERYRRCGTFEIVLRPAGSRLEVVRRTRRMVPCTYCPCSVSWVLIGALCDPVLWPIHACRTAVWPFMAASQGLHGSHPGVRYLTVESTAPESRAAFVERLAVWETRHSAAGYREAGDAAADAGVRVRHRRHHFGPFRRQFDPPPHTHRRAVDVLSTWRP